jgi:AGZA family xanthine/uracil permease-like MFS transporter
MGNEIGRVRGGIVKRFRMEEAGTTPRREALAGFTTFMTMAYIIIVNPSILGSEELGGEAMNVDAVALATILSAAFATILMGLFANLPFALASGMGLNAYFAYTVVLGMGLPWEAALAAVFLDGIIFFVISILPIREKIIQGVPLSLKLATSVGIGLFIAFIGLQNAGLVVGADGAPYVRLGEVKGGAALVLVGLIATGIMLAFRVKGGVLFGILFTAAMGWISTWLGIMEGPAPAGISGVVALPDFTVLGETFGKMDFFTLFTEFNIVTILFTFTFVDLFDTAGTLMGLASKLNIIDERGSFKGAGRAFIVDSIGTIFGALLGTSTVTSYVESAAGVEEGGRTGFTSIIVGCLFLLAIFFTPLIGNIPPYATAPALIAVGLFMIEPVVRIDFRSVVDGMPAFLTIIVMPLTYSIANGLMFGILSYTFLKAITGKIEEVSVVMYVLTGIFVSKLVIDAMLY